MVTAGDQQNTIVI